MELVHIPYSPWSERACWALDHGGRTRRSTVYTPLVSEPAMRLRLRQPTGPVSVPILFVDGRVLRDSWAIAVFVGNNTEGFVPDGSEQIDRLCEQALQSGRILAGHRVLESDEAVLASVPPSLRRLGSVAIFGVRDTWRRMLIKYNPEKLDLEEHRRRLLEALEALETLVSEGPLLGQTFSYADILVASALGFVAPRDDVPLNPAVAQAWSDPRLAERFEGLVSWRDQLRRARRR